MKILHLLYESKGDYFGIGGVGIRAYEIYSYLKQRHDITLLCKKYPNAKNSEIDGIRHLFAGAESTNFTKTLLSYALSARRFVQREGYRYDVIIEEFSPAIPTFNFTYRSRPLILQVQGYTGKRYFEKYNIFYATVLYFFEYVMPRHYQNLIFVSEESKKRFSTGRDKNIGIISNGISSELISINKEESDYILYLGRIDIHNKGLDLLLHAYEQICRSFPGVRLVIAGDGRDRDKLMQSINKLPEGIQGRIELTGWVEAEKKKALFRGALFVVVASRYETQGIVVLEAAASGNALVASNIEELKIVEKVGAGVAFISENHYSLAEQMAFMLKDVKYREACRTRARAWAAQFTWDKTTGEFERFLAQAAGHFNDKQKT